MLFQEELDMSNPFTEEQTETITAIRENVLDILENVIGYREIATNIEQGCYLYACMIACVDCHRDEKLFQRWSQCYSVKLTEMSTPIAVAVSQDIADKALLIPFISRSILFESTRSDFNVFLSIP